MKRKRGPATRKQYAQKGSVKAKKHLGQHFLRDTSIAKKIADTLTFDGYRNVLEIGPGTGVLTQYLLQNDVELTVMDVDHESITYLQQHFLSEHSLSKEEASQITIVEANFLKYDLHQLFGEAPFAITGNFPYNISTQIVFKMLEYRSQIPEFTGMFQKEVAERICEREGSKTYGILSVLVQAFYEAEYLFTVGPEVFTPPPKVHSGVIRLKRKPRFNIQCDETLFHKVVKTAFNQRRKTLRNSLKALGLSNNLREDAIFDRRPEQLSVSDFIALTQRIADDTV